MKNKKNNKSHTVITTHINADFDAIASMLAAQKLYPNSLVVFPGSSEKNLRNFFVNSMAYLFNMVKIKDIDFLNIKRLILVDTRHKKRIGKFAEILDNPGLEIHIYDHHPKAKDDISGNYEVCHQTGATVTILTKIIEEKKIELTPDEATILCLGIYEDTGSFHFSSTTKQDFLAAGFLVSKGANLNVISSMITREISPEQVMLLNDMLQASMTYNINGINVVLTSISSEHYIADFAFLVHKMIKMENYNVIFALARMEDKIYIVGRSRITEVDVGSILVNFGGGGHHFAASATIKSNTLAQTEEKLIKLLYENVRSSRYAKDIMSSPAIYVMPDTSCKEAEDLLTRYNINVLLVVKKDRNNDILLGFITRQIIGKAIYHMLDKISVKEYMTTDIVSVGSDADIIEIQEKIIETKQRVLPVIDKNSIVGVITRTDLLNILIDQSSLNYEKSPERALKTVSMRTRNISALINERLSVQLINILKDIGETASGIGFNAYVVGGFVRDLFLNKKNEDIDIVVEGDGIAFARRYAKLNGARINAYAKFGTAVIIFPDGFKIDVASSRLEYYKFPTALPTVEKSSLKLDLIRRDFTINTLSINLSPKLFGNLVDFFSAQKDIKDKAIRVLHNLSFVEDPTRAFRAIRFEQRFGFKLGKFTSGLIKNAAKMDLFNRLAGFRVFSELKQILEEENPLPALTRLDEYELLQIVHPKLTIKNETKKILNSVKQVISWYDLLFLEEKYLKWSVYFMSLIRNWNEKTSKEICTHLEISENIQKIVINDRLKAEKVLNFLERRILIKNSMLYQQLCQFKTNINLYIMAITKKEKIKKLISHYFTNLRNVKISVNGNDLKKLGIAPGPKYKKILQEVLDAKLNNLLKTRQDELKYLNKFAN